jgi:hypothetical protein
MSTQHLKDQLEAIEIIERTFNQVMPKPGSMLHASVSDAWNAAHDANTALRMAIAEAEADARWAAIPPEQMGTALLAAQNID